MLILATGNLSNEFTDLILRSATSVGSP